MALIDDRPPLTLLQRDRPLRPDLLLVVPYLLLSAFGLLMIYTSTAPRLEALGVDPGGALKRQAVFIVVGFVAFAITSMIDLKALQPWVAFIYLGTIAALLIVLSPLGDKVLGAQRWIQIGPLQLQPSEFAKVAVVLALAVLLSPPIDGPLRWDQVVRAIAVVLLPSLLIFLQPDLGTMLVFGFIGLVMIFVAGATWRQMAFSVVAALVSAVGLFRVGAIQEYQVTRLTAFLDPASDPLGAQYNQAQSEIAIGSGGFTGKGLFAGTQTNLQFIPEQPTDFIFTAIGEQLGFIGGIAVLALYVIIVWRVFAAALGARDRFSHLVAVGVAALVFFHVFVNVGMTIRLMPVTGLPLPFVSAGGSAFLAISIALGLAHSAWIRRSPVPGERQLL